MFGIKTLFTGWGKTVRNRALRGPMSELKRAHAEIARLTAEADRFRSELAEARHTLAVTQNLAHEARQIALDALQKQREQEAPIGLGVLANDVLEKVGLLVNTPQGRGGDVTRIGAIGFPSWEDSVASYRPAFERAIDYLRSVQCVGPVLEFGTCTGFTARTICDLMNSRGFDQHLYMYDSFEGLPETTGTPDEQSYEVKSNKVWHLGAMAVPPRYEDKIWNALIQVRPAEKLHIVKGFYDATLDNGLPDEKCSLIHIDCDIYTSTKYVLEKLAEKDRYQDGCVVMFDDWNCNRSNPNMGERRALREFLERFPRWTCSQWFSYGWNGMAMIFHDGNA